MTIQSLLKAHFGFDQFRPLQKDIITTVLDRRDAVVLMPTGGGKSLCYQLPAIALNGMTLVISPLIALMKDQVDALKANGIAAEALSSQLSQEEIQAICESAQKGKIKLLYVAPERLAYRSFRQFLQTLSIQLIVVDEAHCISEWGHDFRPDYRNLAPLRLEFPKATWMALTATATPQVVVDIQQQLQLQQARVFAASFNRENLTYHILPKARSFPKLVQYLESYRQDSSIIYCFSRKQTENLASDLQAEGIKALPYHAGLTPKVRQRTQDAFTRDQVKVIVATIAFGMGIDKSNIRLVVHYSIPKSIEGYYQETGRAGRDGLPSECVLFYSSNDARKHYFFINQMEDAQERELAASKVEAIKRYCEVETCKRAFLLQYFGEEWKKENCQSCTSCLGIKEEQKPSELPYDRELFDQLRQLRRQWADQEQVPAFVVFSDSSLAEMATYFPQSSDAFYRIMGVGRRKLERYGEAFLNVIKAYCQAKGLEEKPIPSRQERRQPRVKKRRLKDVDSTYQETKRLIEQNRSVEDVATIRGQSWNNIMSHLETLLQSGEQVRMDHLKMDQSYMNMIHNAFRESGGTALKPVYLDLGEQVCYEDLRVARLFLNP